MVSPFLWFIVLLGIIAWPQMTLCVILYYHGYWFLGTVALVTSFFSGKDFIHKKKKD